MASEEAALKFTNIFPESHFFWTQGGKVFIDKALKATGGKVAFSAFHAG